MKALALALATLTMGCACRSVVERSADARPDWLLNDGVGHTAGEPTREDAVVVARMKAALPLIEASFGVLLGGTYEEVSTVSTTGDETQIKESLRTEARGHIRWQPDLDYAERVRDRCAETDRWQAWATVKMDPKELKEGLTQWLASRGRTRAEVRRRGHGVAITAREPGWAYVTTATADGLETVILGRQLSRGETVAAPAPKGAVEARVFLSPGPIPGRGHARLRSLYACLTGPPVDRCSLFHRDLR